MCGAQPVISTNLYPAFMNIIAWSPQVTLKQDLKGEPHVTFFENVFSKITASVRLGLCPPMSAYVMSCPVLFEFYEISGHRLT